MLQVVFLEREDNLERLDLISSYSILLTPPFVEPPSNSKSFYEDLSLNSAIDYESKLNKGIYIVIYSF